jgi:hypothetical protein
MLYRAGLPLEQAVPLALAGAVIILALQALLEVTAESVAYTPGQGAVLTAYKRLGTKPVPRVLPLRRLEGLVLEKVGQHGEGREAAWAGGPGERGEEGRGQARLGAVVGAWGA